MKANTILFAVVILSGLLAPFFILGGWGLFLSFGAIAAILNRNDSTTAGTPDSSRG